MLQTCRRGLSRPGPCKNPGSKEAVKPENNESSRRQNKKKVVFHRFPFGKDSFMLSFCGYVDMVQRNKGDANITEIELMVDGKHWLRSLFASA